MLDVQRYPEACQTFRWSDLWDLFEGDPERLNLAHECVDRWLGRGPALRLKHADGRTEERSFEALAAWPSRIANFLDPGWPPKAARVAVMLDPPAAVYRAELCVPHRAA